MRIGFIAFVFFILLGHLARANDFNFIDGTYDMPIKIGETDFIDVVELKTSKINYYQAQLTGTLTVPNAFTADLDGEVRLTLWARLYTFNFTITARENGQEFKVKYVGEFISDDQTRMEGSAYLEDGKLLGHFTAVNRK